MQIIGYITQVDVSSHRYMFYFPQDPEIPKDTNSLIAKAFTEKWSLWTLKEGLTTLVNAIENKLLECGVNILKNTYLTSLEVNDEQKIIAKGAQRDELFVTDHLISGIPSSQLAALLPKEHSVLTKHLEKIKAVTVGVINLEYDGSVLDIEGFGYLYPSAESRKVLGVIFDSCTFAQGNRRTSKSTRLTVSLQSQYKVFV